MDVLLRRAIDKLGRLGEVVKVKPGFARNYLLPMGYAVPVTKANLAQIEKAREHALLEERARIDGLREMAAKLHEVSVTIEGRTNEHGHLFGSVNAAQIVKALKTKGVHLEEKQIRLDAPLKEIGVFEVTVHLHQDVDTTIKVWVVQAKPE